MQGVQVRSLVGKLGSRIPGGAVKKKNYKLTSLVFEKNTSHRPKSESRICQSAVLSSKNGVSRKMQLVQLATQMIAQMFFLETFIIFWNEAEVLCVYFPFLHMDY